MGQHGVICGAQLGEGFAHRGLIIRIGRRHAPDIVARRFRPARADRCWIPRRRSARGKVPRDRLAATGASPAARGQTHPGGPGSASARVKSAKSKGQQRADDQNIDRQRNDGDCAPGNVHPPISSAASYGAVIAAPRICAGSTAAAVAPMPYPAAMPISAHATSAQRPLGRVRPAAHGAVSECAPTPGSHQAFRGRDRAPDRARRLRRDRCAPMRKTLRRPHARRQASGAARRRTRR